MIRKHTQFIPSIQGPDAALYNWARRFGNDLAMLTQSLSVEGETLSPATKWALDERFGEKKDYSFTQGGFVSFVKACQSAHRTEQSLRFVEEKLFEGSDKIIVLSFGFFRKEERGKPFYKLEAHFSGCFIKKMEVTGGGLQENNQLLGCY